MPKNSDYWRERMKMLENALLDDSYETVKNIEEQFNRANKSLEADIARWYQRFADNNEISLAEARRLLASDELAEFKWTVQDYIKRGQSLDKAWAKQLENASARVHISRLESLKIQLQQHAEELAGQTLSGAENTISGTYRESYYHTAFEFQKGIGLGWSLQSIDKAEIDKVLSKPWSTDMKTFRDRCWTNKEALVNSVNKELTQMIMRGEAPDRAISAVQKQFNVAKNKAGRLIMTESAAFAATARQDCFDSLGVEQYVIVGTLDNETCSLCGSLDGKHFKMSEYQVGTTAPPFHPWCRCTTAPYYDDWDEFNVDMYRAARDDEGEYYEVPRDMTYKQWKAKTLKTSGLTNSSESAIINSGAVSGARNPYGDKANEHAVRYYEAVRKMTTDVDRIAKTTGRSTAEIQAIKNYIFTDEHDLIGGRQRFAPDYMMAESWRRLIDGKPEPHDLTLINHEIMEKELMAQGVPQDEAHIMTSKVYDYPTEAREYYGKIKKFKKE